MLHIDSSVNNGILKWHVGVQLFHMCAWFYSEEKKDIVCVKRKSNDDNKKTFWQQRWTNVSFSQHL